jgi:hypothetical protein
MFQDKVVPKSPAKMGIAFVTDFGYVWLLTPSSHNSYSPHFARIEIIAVVHLEVQQWSGKLAGAKACGSDVFTLLKWNGAWKITHKLFHWHDR